MNPFSFELFAVEDDHDDDDNDNFSFIHSFKTSAKKEKKLLTTAINKLVDKPNQTKRNYRKKRTVKNQ